MIFINLNDIQPYMNMNDVKASHRETGGRAYIPLLCWDVISAQRQLHLSKLRKQTNHEVLLDIFRQRGWVFDLDIILTKNYQAIVLTNPKQQILWVSEGFREMTGYPKSFALGRRPSFLQGRNTSESSRNAIRANLSLGVPFTERLVNYKKDRTEYICEVNIYPIRDYQNELSAFLALESEVY